MSQEKDRRESPVGEKIRRVLGHGTQKKRVFWEEGKVNSLAVLEKLVFGFSLHSEMERTLWGRARAEEDGKFTEAVSGPRK